MSKGEPHITTLKGSFGSLFLWAANKLMANFSFASLALWRNNIEQYHDQLTRPKAGGG